MAPLRLQSLLNAFRRPIYWIVAVAFTLVACAVMVFIVIMPGHWRATNMSECDGPYSDKEIHEDPLKYILESHLNWLKKDPYGKQANLCRARLRRVDLRMVNLSSAILTQADLHAADLRGSNLQDAHLQGATLTSAKLQEANLQNAHLQGAILRKANLHGAILQDAHLQGATLTSAELQKANLQKAHLQGAALRNAKLQNADLRQADLHGATLDLAALHGATLDDTTTIDPKGRLVWQIVTSGEAGENLREADLENANLHGVNLQGASLHGAKLTGANLQWANLQRAKLTGAMLLKAHLDMANLREADLERAELPKAELSGANLYEANLYASDLSQAKLVGADLTATKLVGTILADANMERANLARTVFQPASLPDIRTISKAYHLSQMTFRDSQAELLKLAKAFREQGMEEQSREVSYARFSRLRSKYWEEGKTTWSLTLLIPECACAYSMLPGRPLEILGFLILTFGIAYMLALRSREGDSVEQRRSPHDEREEPGIWVKWPRETEEKPVRITPKFFFPKLLEQSAGRCWGRPFRRLCALLISFYFSLHHVGIATRWGNINLGEVLKRLRRREYDIEPTGWVRVVSGLQSIISAGLLAISAVCIGWLVLS